MKLVTFKKSKIGTDVSSSSFVGRYVLLLIMFVVTKQKNSVAKNN
jgi:hypothetical protein